MSHFGGRLKHKNVAKNADRLWGLREKYVVYNEPAEVGRKDIHVLHCSRTWLLSTYMVSLTLVELKEVANLLTKINFKG